MHMVAESMNCTLSVCVSIVCTYGIEQSICLKINPDIMLVEKACWLKRQDMHD